MGKTSKTVTETLPRLHGRAGVAVTLRPGWLDSQYAARRRGPHPREHRHGCENAGQCAKDNSISSDGRDSEYAKASHRHLNVQLQYIRDLSSYTWVVLLRAGSGPLAFSNILCFSSWLSRSAPAGRSRKARPMAIWVQLLVPFRGLISHAPP